MRTPALWLIACVACAGAIAGCNSVLGIHAPSGELLDGGPGGGGAVSEADSRERIMRRAAWPMPNPETSGLDNSTSYLVDDRGFVTDEVTHLVWQQTVHADVRSRQEAEEYCAELSLGDEPNFRLPWRIELLSLIDFTKAGASIDDEVFPLTPAEYYWTASTYVDDISVGWLVNFGPGPGFLSTTALESDYRVRCVAGPVAADSMVTYDSYTVTDLATQLEWQREARDARYSYSEAATYCEALDLNGPGWRVPTVKELQTLVDETVSNPCIDREAFPSTLRDNYWSSSPVAGSESMAWTVNFHYGFDGRQDVTTALLVRCVR